MFCKYQDTVVFAFILIIVFFVSSERPSGLYIDNGLNQTIAHEVISHEEKRQIEDELLDLLGLPNRPKRIMRRALLVKRSAPKFLLNIYNNVLSDTGDTWIKVKPGNTGEFDLSGHDITAIDQSDMIMTFGAHNPHSSYGSRKNRGKRIWFDVSEVPPVERVIAAELRLYQNKDFGKLQGSVSYTITVYRVAYARSGERMKHYVDSTNTTLDREGWITLNVSQALKYWMSHPTENRGLFLAVHQVDYSGHIMRPDDIGIVGVLGVPDKQPFMVGFFKTSRIREAKIRRERDIKRQNEELTNMSLQKNPYISPKVRHTAKACNIQTLYVNFKDLQWQDWIIAPEGYDAYYCSGECNFPLNNHMNATNHAIVQILVHLMKPGGVPKPCCAPTKLSPISVLYFLDDSNVVLKKYKNMVVNSCGCH